MHSPPLETRFRNALRCPKCHGTLDEQKNSAIKCRHCEINYPVVGTCPVLITEENSLQLAHVLQSDTGQQMVEEYQQQRLTHKPEQKSPLSYLLNLLRPPEIMLRYQPDLTEPPTSILFGSTENPKLVLNVGGGPTRESSVEYTLNMEPFPNVDLVADAHDIPLEDESVDSVFSVAVLEHVTAPEVVVAEMIRILKPGGHLYSEIPFMFFFHGYPSDFRRYTREGIKLLFADLDEIEVGLTHGPVSATLQSANMIIGMIVPSRFPRLTKILNGLFRWLFFPFKYLDLLLRDHEDAHSLAGGFYVIGRKPDLPGSE